MNKIIIKIEIEVPEDMVKFEKYGLIQGALDQIRSQISEENQEGRIDFITENTSGSWELKEVDDEVE